MLNYELTFLVKEPKTAETVKKTISESAAKIKDEKHWGERALAYPIKKNHTAHYFTLVLEVKPEGIAELKRKLNFNDSIIRFLLLKQNN